MAERRMFSKRVINSARFLKMPSSTQALYFHLGLNADDDGVVEAFPVMRLVGATEDDLKLLFAKNFIHILNDDLVTFIIDWKENNKLRADRKIDSIYKDLLLQVLPDTQLLESKPRADRKNSYYDNGTSQGQPMDEQVTTNGQTMDCLGKDSIGKDSIGKDSIIYMDLSFIDDCIENVNITQSQYNKLISKYNKNDVDREILQLDNYIVNGKGKKYKDHYRVLLTWCNKNSKSVGVNNCVNNKKDKFGECPAEYKDWD